MPNPNNTIKKTPHSDSFEGPGISFANEAKRRASVNNRHKLSTLTEIRKDLVESGILLDYNELMAVAGEGLLYPKICEYNVDILNPFNQGV